MLAALITMGVVACTEKEQEVDKTPEPAPEVLSFEATIDGVIETRTDVVLDEQSGDWNTVWAGNEKLAVSDSSGAKYYFTNSKENKGLFSSSDANVKSLVGKDVRIDLVQTENGKKEIDSRAGKGGGSLVAEVKGFNPEERVSLSVESAFLRYSSAFEVTLQASQAIFMYDKSTHTALALPAGEDVWVAVKSCDTAVTVSCSIGGVNCLEQELNIEKKGLYNLGTLTPAPGAVSSVYFVPNEDWKSDDAWFAAYVWNEAGDNSSIVLGDVDEDGVYECALPAEMTNIIFCRMNPAYTEFAWNSETEADHVWNQTEDLTVGVAPNNYFYITGWATGEWHEAGFVPETPVVEAIVWSLAGSFNEWGDAIMEATELENLYVVKGLELKSGDEIKVKDSKTWETSYGGGITNLEANKWMKAYLGGANVVVAASGTYDVYFEYAEAAEYSKIYLVEMDGDYTLAEEQTANGTLVPDEPEDPDQPVIGEPTKYGVVGTFQGWDVANSVVMVTAEDGWVVARGVELYKDDEIKIVEDKSWSVSYGLGTLATLDVDVEYVLNKGGQNIACAKNGRFDIYFKASEAKFKYTCVEEYADLTVNISINNKANWNPLRILLKSGDTLLTAAEGDVVTGDSFAVSGDYIGSTLTYQFFTDGKQSEPANINITKNGATVTLEETIIKLIFKLDTDNSKQYWGTTAKIHVWNTGTSFDTSWPGNAMTYDGDHTWHIIVPSELVGKTINYLVHNGNGWQSKDSKVTINAAGNTVTGSSIGVN